MKNFYNYIKENNETKIVELSFYDFINICDQYKAVEFKDKTGFTICDIVKQVKEYDEQYGFSNKSNKYHFLVALNNKNILGVFYKQLRGNPDIYDDGYIISKGVGKELFNEMKKLGPYTTFSNISNIASIKSQLQMGGEIICLTDSAPEKPSGIYNKEIQDESLKELLIEEKLYYKVDDEKFFILDENGKFKQKEFIDFILNNDRIQIIEPKKDLASKIKIYFLFK